LTALAIIGCLFYAKESEAQTFRLASQALQQSIGHHHALPFVGEARELV
jgi:hypothetical protein